MTSNATLIKWFPTRHLMAQRGLIHPAAKCVVWDVLNAAPRWPLDKQDCWTVGEKEAEVSHRQTGVSLGAGVPLFEEEDRM